MAFSIEIESSSGAPATYHRVPSITVDCEARTVVGTLASFYSHEARAAGKGTLGANEFTITNKNWPYDGTGIKAKIRDMLHLSEEQRLVNLTLYFDGDIIHCRVNLETPVGASFASGEIQFQMNKTEAPIDFLAPIYKILGANVPFDKADFV